MKALEKVTPAAAVVAALSTLACCLPLGLLSALGFAAIAARVAPLRPWLLGASLVLLCLGFWQLYFRKTCVKRSAASLVLFWTAAIVVVLVLLFPQVIASLIAG
jgi:hypothetical protein